MLNSFADQIWRTDLDSAGGIWKKKSQATFSDLSYIQQGFYNKNALPLQTRWQCSFEELGLKQTPLLLLLSEVIYILSLKKQTNSWLYFWNLHLSSSVTTEDNNIYFQNSGTRK